MTGSWTSWRSWPCVLALYCAVLIFLVLVFGCLRSKTQAVSKLTMNNQQVEVGLEAGFAQASEMYRHFIHMRYLTFTVYGVVTAALATLFFVQLPNMSDPRAAGAWIKTCGSIVSLVCFAFEICLTLTMIFYRDRMEEYADHLGLANFGPLPMQGHGDYVLFIASVVIYSISIVAWFGFAEVPVKAEAEASRRTKREDHA